MRALLALAALLLSGCSISAGPVVPATPHAQWTNSDVLTCKAAATSAQRWEGRISKTDRLIVDNLQSGDIAAARNRVGKVTKTVLADLNTQVGQACDPELAALEDAMATGLTALDGPMTADQYRATYLSIRGAVNALSDKATEVKGWVHDNVPQ